MRLLRLLRGAALGLAGMILLLGALVAWLALTTSGAQVAAHVAGAVEPRLELRVTGGSLARGVDVEDVRWADAAVEAEVGEGRLRWRPQRLLQGVVQVDELTVSGVSVALAEGEADAAPAEPAPPREEPIELPEIALPVEVVVERAQVDRAALTLPDGRTERLQRLEAVLRASGPDWRLERLLVEREDARLEADGEVRTAGDYPLALLLRGTAAAPGLPERAQLSLRAGGSAAELHLSGTLGGPVSGAFEGRLDPLDPALPLRLEAHGIAGGWPLDTRETVAARDLAITVSGDIDGISGRFSGEVSGEHIPRGDWAGELAVDAEGAVLDGLEGELLDGQATGRAELTWDDAGVHWDVDAVAEALDPSLEWPAAPEAVSGPVQVAGQAGGPGWALEIDTPGLSGEHQGAPFELAGSARHTLDGAWRFERIRLGAAGGHLHVDGELAEAWDLALEADLPELGALDERLGGSLAGSAEITGEPGELDIASEGRAADLRWAEYTLGSARWAAEVPALAHEPGTARLLLRDGELPQGRLEELELVATGTRAAHHVALSAQGLEDALLRLGVAGGWVPDTGWSGLVVDAEGEARGERVALEAPFPLRYEAGVGEAGAHCWTFREARLCLPDGVRGSAERADAALTLEGVDLAWLEPLIPGHVDWDGVLSGDGRLQWDAEEGLDAGLQAESRDGRLRLTLYEEADDEPVAQDLAYDRLAIEGALAGERVEVALSLDAPEAGSASVRLATETMALDGPISGQARIDGLRMRFFRGFIPELSDLAGEVDLDARIGGTPGDPRLDGTLMLTDGRVAVPQSGSAVEALELELALAGREATLDGGFRVGAGRARIGGDARWGDGTFAADIDLDGEGLEADVPPYAQLDVAPRLSARIEPGEVDVSGRVQIPRGRIEVRELPERVVSPSRDVVVVRRDEAGFPILEEPPEGWDISADVEVGLGDAVSLSGFGLTGRLAGAMRVLQQPTGETEAYGELRVEEGRYRAYGQRLTIRRGTVLFTGALDRPQLDVEAVRVIERDGVTAGIRVQGFADRPETTLFSEPTMSNDDALSYLIRGRPMGADGPGGDEMLATAAIALGIHGGGGALGAVAEGVGIQDFEIDTAGEGEDAEVVLSGYITPRLYAAYGVAVFAPVNTVTLRYYLTWQLYLEAISGQESSLDLMYRFEID